MLANNKRAASFVNEKFECAVNESILNHKLKHGNTNIVRTKT